MSVSSAAKVIVGRLQLVILPEYLVGSANLHNSLYRRIRVIILFDCMLFSNGRMRGCVCSFPWYGTIIGSVLLV